MTEPVYLRPDVTLEPLVHGWFARPQLISPITSAMNLRNRFIRIMKSYVSYPAAHAMAVGKPELMGGAFLDYPEEKVDDIKDLLARTEAENGDLIALVEAVDQLAKLLREEAEGYSLEPFYDRIPDPLRGYVELCYDLEDQPRIRFIEPLLYQGPYYKASAQSIALGLVQGDHRPFVLSTPRLPNEENLHLRVPLASPLLDNLFRLRHTPAPRETVLGWFAGIEKEGGLTVESLLTTETPAPRPAFTGEGIRIRYFGHACVLVESSETSVLIDPVISYIAPEGAVERFTFADLPEKIDYVFITHAHQDHILLETLLQLRHRIGTILVPRNNNGQLADPNLCLMLRHLGFEGARAVDEMEQIPIPGGFITGLPFLGEHGDLDITSKHAGLVNLKGTRIVFAADSSNLDPTLYRHIRGIIGDVDILFIGMECVGAPMSWIYGPLFTRPINNKIDTTRRLSGSDHQRASAIVSGLGVQSVYIYALGQEPWLEYFMSVSYDDASPAMVESKKVMLECLSRGLTCDRPVGKMELELPPK